MGVLGILSTMKPCLIFTILIVFNCWQYSSSSPQTRQEVIDRILASNAQELLRDGIPRFAESMYLYMRENGTKSTFVFSPLSLHSGLSLLYLGTKHGSETEQELAMALDTVNSRNILETSYRNVVNTYENQPNFVYANNIWVQLGFQVNPNFIKSTKKALDSGIDVIDFGGRKSVGLVNSWISKNTGGKIKEFVKSFSPGTSMFLANALYFNEKWEVPFDDKDFITRESIIEDFTTLDNEVVRVPMITQISPLTGYQLLKMGSISFEVINIPYKNPLFEMQIILPKNVRDFTLLEAGMISNKKRDFDTNNKDSFDVFSQSSRSDVDYFVEDVSLTMPTFNIRTDLDAAEPLQVFGAKRVFTSRAELDELAAGGGAPLYVNGVSHTAVIEVTKEGTEGAAATGVQIALLSASFGEQKNIIVNRPFIFVIQDKVNKIPILVGRVTDPSG